MTPTYMEINESKVSFITLECIILQVSKLQIRVDLKKLHLFRSKTNLKEKVSQQN